MKRAYAVLQKDIASELRTRYAVNSLFMFVLISVSIILFALRSENVSVDILAGLYWVVMFFASSIGLSRSFVSEEERGTALTLQLIASPMSVYAGKFLYNAVLSLLLNLLVTILYFFFFPSFQIASLDIFLLVMLLGSLGFSAASTILAAIIAKANARGALFPVLSFPVMVPLLMTIMNATAKALEGASLEKAAPEFQVLISYIIVLVGGSYLLFDYVWKD